MQDSRHLEMPDLGPAWTVDVEVKQEDGEEQQPIGGGMCSIFQAGELVQCPNCDRYKEMTETIEVGAGPPSHWLLHHHGGVQLGAAGPNCFGCRSPFRRSLATAADHRSSRFGMATCA